MPKTNNNTPANSGETKEKYRKCDGRKVICPTLAKRLEDGHRKGLNLQRVMNLKTLDEKAPIILYRTASTSRGLVLNFCPWCGSELNIEYRKADE